MAMTYDITPIPTLYNGIQFRSRLEARWAVFFDTLGIKYEYEPANCIGFEQRLGYLPDFYLPEYDIYAEVKGTAKQLQEDAPKILDNIDWDGSLSTGVIILGAIPNFSDSRRAPQFYYWYYYGSGVGVGECLFDVRSCPDKFYRSVKEIKKQDRGLDIRGLRGEKLYNLKDTGDILACHITENEAYRYYKGENESRVIDMSGELDYAYRCARSHKFNTVKEWR